MSFDCNSPSFEIQEKHQLVFLNDPCYIRGFVSRFPKVEVTMPYMMEVHVKYMRSILVSEICEVIAMK